MTTAIQPTPILANIPGPTPAKNPLAQLKLGWTLSRDTLNTFTRWRESYGDFYVLRVGGLLQFMVSHPDDIREVLATQSSKFIKSEEYRDPKIGLARFVGNGLLTSDGEFWKRQRRLASPAFHARRIESYAQTMVDHTLALLDRWQGQTKLDASEEMTSLTMSIVAKALFNFDTSVDAQRVNDAVGAMQDVLGSTWFLPPWVPNVRERRAQQARRDLDDIVYRIIRERRASGEDQGDLLSMLMLAEDEDGQRMTDQQLRDEVVTLFLAGHETTANTLSWTWYLLAQHPVIEAQLHAEVDSVLKGRAPTLADLPRLVYTEMVIKEVMRLYPPAWSVGREAVEDVHLSGGFVPKGSNVGVIIYDIHRDPRWWPNPTRFDPQRFNAENKGKINPFVYLPFGAGPRICIGANFALMEARLLLATIASRYRLSLVPGHKVTPAPMITMYPKHGLMVRLERRA